MRKLSKREIILLSVLIISLLIYGGYEFFIKKQLANLNKLENEKKLKTKELSLMNKKISNHDKFEKDLKKLNIKARDINSLFYSKLNQEDFIVILNRLNTFDNFTISSFAFNENKDGEYNYLLVDLDYKGLYENLYKYIKAIEEHKKYIYVNDIDVSTQMNGVVQGQLTVKIPQIKSLGNIEEKSFFEKNGQLVETQVNNPYIPYESLKQKMQTDSEDEKNQIEIYISDRLIYPISNFDTSKPFFVSSDYNITGKITKSLTRLYGTDSYKLSYDFGVKKAFSEANFAFEKELIIQKQREFISLWVNAKEITGHQVGVVLTDSAGNFHDITLTSSVDWKGWQVLESSIPIEVNYPAKIQRLYVRSTDYDQKLGGTLLFDQLQIADSKDSND